MSTLYNGRAMALAGMRSELNNIKRSLYGYDVFISYARQDGSGYAHALAAELTRTSYASTYLDREFAAPGYHLPDNVRAAIQRSRAIVVIITDAALTSPAFAAEVAEAVRSKQPIIPILCARDVDGVRSSPVLRHLEGIPFVIDTTPDQAGPPAYPVLQLIQRTLALTRRGWRIRRQVLLMTTVAALGLAGIFLVGLERLVNGVLNADALLWNRLIEPVVLPFVAGAGTVSLGWAYSSRVRSRVAKEAGQELRFAAAGYESCFISHSTKDGRFVLKLHKDLIAAGVRCWYAPRDVRAGRKLHEQIYQAIAGFDRLLLVLSRHSLESPWVKTEIQSARAKEVRAKTTVLLPVRLVHYDVLRSWTCFDADSGIDAAREIREYFIPDFTNWQHEERYRASLTQVLEALKRDTNDKRAASRRS